MSDPWNTALGRQAARFESELGSFVRAAERLAELGARDEEIQELYYPRCNAAERRLLDRAIEAARSEHFATLTSEYRQLIDKARVDRGREPRDWGAAEEPEPADPDWSAVVAGFDRWHARDENADRRLTLERMVEETDIGRDRITEACHRHGVMDFRYLAGHLRATRR